MKFIKSEKCVTVPPKATTKKSQAGFKKEKPMKENLESKSKASVEQRQSMLGYKKERQTNNVKVDQAARVAVIYDHSIHKKSVKQIIKDHGVNYSTVRHILLQYYLFGRTDIRKFRHQAKNAEALKKESQEQHFMDLRNLDTRAATNENSPTVSHPQSPRAQFHEPNQLICNGFEKVESQALI